MKQSSNFTTIYGLSRCRSAYNFAYIVVVLFVAYTNGRVPHKIELMRFMVNTLIYPYTWFFLCMYYCSKLMSKTKYRLSECLGFNLLLRNFPV